MDPSSIMPTYKRLEVCFERGEGVWLYDTEGRRYLDALAGIAVCGLGHAHPAVTRAIQEQAARLLHTSNVYGITRQRELADRLVALSGMDNVFFGNSGAEANECAIKIARMYGHGKNIEKPAIIVMENSFHGRTLATLSATGSRKVQAGFEPLVSGFVRARFGDLEELASIARNNQQHRRGAGGADPGRVGRPRGARGLPRGPARAVRPARLAADAGRGADRQRAHGQAVCVPAHARSCPTC